MRRLIIISLLLFSSLVRAAVIQTPSETCELIDGTEYSDLLTSVKSLNEKMSGVPKDCLVGPAGDSMKSSKDLQDSAVKLQEYWNNTALVTQNVGDFSTTIKTAMGSVNSIAQNIQTGALSAACAKSANSTLEILSRLSDVALNLAPIGMMALAVVKVAVPGWALLGVGAGAVVAQGVKTLNEMKAKKLINIDSIEQRALVMKSICDYKKVKRHLDFISFMEAGRAKVKLEKTKLSTEINTLIATLSVNDRQQIQDYDKQKKVYEDAQARINSSRLLLRDFQSAVGANPFPQAQCRAGIVYLSRFDVLKSLNYESFQISSINPKINPAQLQGQLIGAEANYLTVLDIQTKMKSDATATKYADCQQDLVDWQTNMISLFQSLRSITTARAAEHFIRLQKQEKFQLWAEKQKDHNALEKVLAYMGPEGSTGSQISRAEVSDQYEEIHKILLGEGVESPNSWGISSQVTFVGEWLKKMTGRFKSGAEKFETKFSQLNNVVGNHALQMARTKGLKKVERDPVEAQIFMSDNLEQLNGAYFKVSKELNEKNWITACGELKELYLIRYRAVSYYDAVETVCKSLTELKNASLHRDIIETCFGNAGFERKHQVKSWLELQSLNYDKGLMSFNHRSTVVRGKMTDLKCDIPVNPNN